MDLYSHHPFWLMKNGIVNTYPSLKKNLNIDIAIIGSGISGALAAHYLCDTGSSIAIFDRRHAAMGSTAASTAFLQYEIDTPMVTLSQKMGEKKAVRCYELCRKAIYDIETLHKKLHPDFDFSIRPSLQYASFKKHREQLYTEYQLRKKHGFAVEWLEPEDIQRTYGMDAPGAILSADGGEVDAYLLTHALLQYVQRKGHAVYDNTTISDIKHHRHNVELTTADGCRIKAKWLIIACGYESQKYLSRQVADIHATYALVSEPMDTGKLWHRNSLVWETAEPYLYFRMADKHRVLIGGKDDKFHNAEIRDSRIKRKTEMLLHSFHKKMSHIELKADFSWAGAFAVTKDGLPYIGSVAERPRTFFALGYGGNGITFSCIAAQLIRDTLLKKTNGDMELFGFNR